LCPLDPLPKAMRLHSRRVPDPGVGGLSENGRRIADVAEVDTSNIDGLEQRWTKLKINPLDIDAQWLEGVLDCMALPDCREKETTLLSTDADDSGLIFSMRS
jgi:hypothetical protein